MRMAPEGLVAYVQLAICRNPVAVARKQPRNRTGRTAFSNARTRDSTCCHQEHVWPILESDLQLLSAGLMKKREGNILNLVVFFVCFFAESIREEVATAWHSQCLKIMTAPRLQPSPPAAPLLNRQHITRRRPEETHWHSTAALLLLFRGT